MVPHLCCEGETQKGCMQHKLLVLPSTGHSYQQKVMAAVHASTKCCSKTLCPFPSLLTTACPQADGTAQEMLSTATGSPNALNVTKFQSLKSKYIKNRVENQWLHILVVTARTCWYKSEYWFYQFTSNNSQLVHSNHTGYWIHASVELCRLLLNCSSTLSKDA